MTLSSAFARGLCLACGFLLGSTSFVHAGEPPLPPGVVARQGGAEVTLQDIDAFTQRIPLDQRAGYFNSPERIQDLITNLLAQKQVAAEARKLDLQDKPQVRKQIELATEEVLVRARMDKFRKDLKLPDFAELAQEEYQAHPDKYVEYGRVDVEEVLVTTKDRKEADARALAQKVRKEAMADPASFEALVEKYSDDPSRAKNHGLIENAGGDQVDKDFARTARALTKPGQISPVVKSQFGFHVLKLISRQPDRQKSFAEVRDLLIAQLRQDYIDKQARTHLDELRGNKLDANPDLVASLRTRYDGGVPPPDAPKSNAPGRK